MRRHLHFTRFGLVIALFHFVLTAHAAWQSATVPSRENVEQAAPVWYRCFVRVPDNMVTPAEKDLWRDSITLSVGGIETPFTIWLNGQKIGNGDALIGNRRRRFKVPKGILEKKAFNVLALRLEATGGNVGLGMTPILAGYFDELELSGAWQKFAGEPEPQDLKPTRDEPSTAAYTEAGFHPAATPLAVNPELMPGQRLSPADSLGQMKAADDLQVELVLSEPQVAQPTQISFDERGRMWIAQYRQYPFPAGLRMVSRDKFYRARFDRVPPPPPHQDRGNDVISVHEDTNGDGIYDSHRIVLDGLNMANSVVRGHGGIWVMHTPYLLFYPDADGDDVPDTAPEVRLAGFGLEDTHSVANGLTWGPDGWLYGGQGSTVTSRVTRPGIDPSDFPGIYQEGCMIWRYHPRTKEYEVFAEGGGNVFGLEFDSQGRLYSGHNGGDTRGWHYVQGGLFLKQGVDPGKFGPPPHPYAFGHLDMMKSRNPIQRFSHATVVIEGTAFPKHYSGRFLAADPLHRNIVVAERYHRGSTFETSDSGIAVASTDPAFRPVYLANGPDGAVYAADFYEEFIAHGQNYQGQIDPSTGRIYRLRGKESALNKDVDLSRKTSKELLELLSHPNRWHRHTAVRLLSEKRDPSALASLRALLEKTEEHPALEALWVLHQIQALDETTALRLLKHPQPAVRAWTVRLIGDSRQLPEQFARAVLDLAGTEADAEVRAQMAGTAGRLPAGQALPLAAALLRRGEDVADPYIPLLCWWAIEPHCEANRDKVLTSLDWNAESTKRNILGRLMRRFASAGGRNDLLTCARLLDSAPTAEHRRLLITGFEEAFTGRALPQMPEPLLQALARSGFTSRDLRVRLREPEAISEAIRIAADEKATSADRLGCIRLLGEINLPESIPTLLQVVSSAAPAELRKAALTSLLIYEDPAIADKVAKGYAALPKEVQQAAQTLLTSRQSWSRTFLKLIEAGTIDKATIPPATAMLLREHSDQAVASLAQKVFSAVTSQAKVLHSEVERLRKVLLEAPGDPYKGEPIFMQRCSVCHRLFYKGGQIGPDLTAYQRDDLGTLLPSILAPSAEIREGYVNQLLTTTDNRTISGFVSDQDASVIVLRGLDGQDITIRRSEIRELRPSTVSLMPEGLLQGLSDQELRDFFAYLRISQPITR